MGLRPSIHSVSAQDSYFPGTGKSPGNREVSREPGSQIPGTKKSLPSYHTPSMGIDLPETKTSFPGNQEVISWELGSNFPGTGKSSPSTPTPSLPLGKDWDPLALLAWGYAPRFTLTYAPRFTLTLHRAVIYREPGSLPGTGKPPPGNREVTSCIPHTILAYQEFMSWKPGIHRPETGMSYSRDMRNQKHKIYSRFLNNRRLIISHFVNIQRLIPLTGNTDGMAYAEASADEKCHISRR